MDVRSSIRDNLRVTTHCTLKRTMFISWGQLPRLVSVKNKKEKPDWLGHPKLLWDLFTTLWLHPHSLWGMASTWEFWLAIRTEEAIHLNNVSTNLQLWSSGYFHPNYKGRFQALPSIKTKKNSQHCILKRWPLSVYILQLADNAFAKFGFDLVFIDSEEYKQRYQTCYILLFKQT